MQWYTGTYGQSPAHGHNPPSSRATSSRSFARALLEPQPCRERTWSPWIASPKLSPPSPDHPPPPITALPPFDLGGRSAAVRLRRRLAEYRVAQILEKLV